MEFIRFWWRCIWEGWHIGDGIFGGIEGLCFIIGAGLHWFKKTHKLHGVWEKWEPKIMKAAFGIFALAFLTSTVFVAPFLQFEASDRQARAATDELTRLRPVSGEAPYQTLAKELASTKAEVQAERKARMKAEEDADYNKQQGLKWLFASSNTSTAIPVLDDAIAATKRELEAMSTNDRPRIGTILQREAELKKLEQVRTFEQKKDAYSQYFALLLYAISAYQDRFSAPITKCGGTIEPFPTVPESGWWGFGTGERKNTLSTNCNVRFEYSFWARMHPTTLIALQSKKTKKSSRVEFILSDEPLFHSRFFMGASDEFRVFKASSLEDKTNCIREVNYVLDLLLDSQREEFQ